MIAISDRNYATPSGMLTTWIEHVKLAGVKNALVVALDAQTKSAAEALGLAAHEMHLTVSLHLLAGTDITCLRTLLLLRCDLSTALPDHHKCLHLFFASCAAIQ